MPAKSKSQQRLMGMVHAIQKGEKVNASAKVKEMARKMDPDDAKDFAETKHKGLPVMTEKMASTLKAANLIANYVLLKEAGALSAAPMPAKSPVSSALAPAAAPPASTASVAPATTALAPVKAEGLAPTTPTASTN